MKRRWTIAMAVALCALTGCRLGDGKPDGSGTIECTQVQIAPQVGGRLASVQAQEGDALKTGQLVAQIDPTDCELRLAEARAAARAVEADYQRIKTVFEKKSATQKQMDDAQAAVDLAHARLAMAEKAVADCAVRAPTNGVVSIRCREAGEMIAPGMPVVVLERLDDVWLSIYVPEKNLGLVKLGQPARVKLDGDGKMYEGTVTFVASEAEFTPRNVQTPDERAKLVYRVKIALKNPDGIFKPGMPADGYLRSAK
jgi:HlyD family secretion protein